MTQERTFAAWVEPLAASLRESQQEVEQVAQAIPAESWAKESGYAGWSYKDQLAHLPESYRGITAVLRAIVEGRGPDFSRFDDIDALNEANRQAHLSTPVNDLLAELTIDGDALQDVLAELRPEHAGFNLGPMLLSQALQGFTLHDRAHLAELRKALA
jgi:hypothetical protein